MKDWLIQICLNHKGEAVSVKDRAGNEIPPHDSLRDDTHTGRIKDMAPMAFIEAEPAHRSVGSAATASSCYWVCVGGKYYLICN